LLHIVKSIFVFSSFLLILTQTSISQPVDFDFMFGWGVDTGAGAFQICTSADTPCQAGISGSGDGQFDAPFGIAVDSMKNIYVADLGNNRIQVFNSAGIFLFEFGSLGGGDGQFDDPSGIAVDSMKNIYVADFGNHRIQVFNSAGNFLFEFGSLGGGDGQFFLPSGIAVDSMKNIYVADFGNNRIQVFDSAGSFLFMYGWGVDDGTSVFQICSGSCQAGINGSGDGQFDNPRGIAVDSMKNIYVAGVMNDRIQVLIQQVISYSSLVH